MIPNLCPFEFWMAGKGGTSGVPRQDEKRSRPLVSDEDRDKSLTRSASPAGQYFKPDLWPLRLACQNHLSSSLSLLVQLSLSRKTILCADHCLSRIRGGDSQVPSESFVTEVISEAPLTLNYISLEEGDMADTCETDLSSSLALTQTNRQEEDIKHMVVRVNGELF